MRDLSKHILTEILKDGFCIDTPSFLSDGRVAGSNRRRSYKELMDSKLGLSLYEGEDSSGNTLLIFSAVNTGAGALKEDANVDYLSSKLNDEELKNLFYLK